MLAGPFTLCLQALLVYAYNLCLLCLQALSFMPTGPRSFTVFICCIDCIADDMLSLLSRNGVNFHFGTRAMAICQNSYYHFSYSVIPFCKAKTKLNKKIFLAYVSGTLFSRKSLIMGRGCLTRFSFQINIWSQRDFFHFINNNNRHRVKDVRDVPRHL